MSISGVEEKEYTEFLKHGGEVVFQIDAKDIDSTGGFEKSPLIAPKLLTGFELKPSSVIEQPRENAELIFYGGSWSNVIAHVYSYKGRIIYKKLENGHYEARAKTPRR